MRGSLARATRTLLAASRPGSKVPIVAEDLARLPPPVQGHLRRTGVVGLAPLHTVRLRQRGEMRIGAKWIPFTAEEVFADDPPGFVWAGRATLAPLLTASGGDIYAGGRGRFTIRLWGVLPLARADGPELDEAELQRYLAETSWFPTVWLSPAVRWRPVDARSAEVTMTHSGATATGVADFNLEGMLSEVRFDRFRYAGRAPPTRVPWAGRLREYHPVGELRIPVEIDASWEDTERGGSYFRARLTEIAFDGGPAHRIPNAPAARTAQVADTPGPVRA